MALNKVEICGVNTSKLPVLTAEEKAELFRRIKNGDEQARELYIKGNLRLVLSVIRRFQNSSENADDLFMNVLRQFLFFHSAHGNMHRSYMRLRLSESF